MAQWNHSKTQGCKDKSGAEVGRAARIVFALLFSGFLMLVRAANVASLSPVGASLVISQQPHRAKDHGPSAPVRFLYSNTKGAGGRIVLLWPRGETRVLTADFASASDASVSFDGNKILFAGKQKTTDPWSIWEMDADGGNKRRLTTDQGNCLEPKYLAMSSITPPEFANKVRWITYLSDRANALDEFERGPGFSLYAQNIEPIEGRGTIVRRNTFGLSSVYSPTVISDGRILFTGRRAGDPATQPDGRFSILACNWDGTGLNLFHEGGDTSVQSMACESPDRTLLFVESHGETADGSGSLARVSFNRPLRSREVLSRDRGFYRSPCALQDSRVLVSYTRGPEARGIYLFDFERGAPGERIHFDPKWDDQSVAVLGPQPEPQGLLSAVVETEPNVDVQCLSIYDSDISGVRALKPGEVKKVRFVEGVPLPSATDSSRPSQPAERYRARILGEASVEVDGSFFVTLPGDTPFYIQVLDGKGMVLQSMSTWIWGRRGTSRSCIGCHENREYAPENRVSQALLKMHPQLLTEPPDKRRLVPSFQSLIPFVQKRCAPCHGGAAGRNKPWISASSASDARKTYDMLTASRGPSPDGSAHVVPGHARSSGLVKMLISRDAGAVGGKHPVLDFVAEEKQALVEWIDFGARWQN
jgi:hypothetical protein